MGEGGNYDITATGEEAARFKRFLAVSAPSAGGEYLSEKFKEFVEEARVEVRPGDVRRTDGGNVAADLIISEGGIEIKHNVYIRGDIIELEFHSTDRSRVELAALLLRHAGVSAEVKKKEGNKDVRRVRASIGKLVAGHEELRNAIAQIVETARNNGRVDAGKAEGWLEELKRGRVLMEGWPEYEVGLVMGALVVRYRSTDRNSIEQEAQRFRDMGLKEGVHFSVKMPEEGRYGYVSILKEGLAYAAWLSGNGSEKQRKLAAKFVEHILQRSKEVGDDVYEKASKIIEEGKARGSQKLKDFEMEV